MNGQQLKKQSADVYENNRLAGVLSRTKEGYMFTYEENYFHDSQAPAISLTLPKTKQVYLSEFLFPFFSGLLAEGPQKTVQCELLNIDDTDDFTRLIQTAHETVGTVTIRKHSSSME